ncbi:MAG: GC-type dockerin domain-anchored protein [Phycisphaerales bacterium]
MPPLTDGIVRLLPAALAFSALVGCSSQESRVQSSNEAPMVLQPDGAVQARGLPADQLPAAIDLSDPSNPVQWVVEAEIIDTNALAVRNQITEPFGGEIRMIKHVLPKHGRDKTMPPPNMNGILPVGETVAMDRINVGAGTGTGFEGIAQTEWSPPDPTLAVGPNHIVETVNAAIAFYDKNGNQTFSSHLGTPGNPGFFETVGASSNFVFDPKCFYDHKSGRFVVIALETIGDTESWIDIAISDDSDPNGVWYKYRTFSVIEIGNSDYWVDYPGFGFDDNAFYVTGNLFLLNGPGDGFKGPLFRVFPKGPMLNGDPVELFDIAPQSGASVQVAQMFGDAPACAFVSRQSATQLRVWTIDDALTSPSIRSTIVSGLAPANGPSQDAPNPGGGSISTLDGRLMNVHVRDGNLYTAHGIDGPPGQTVARWYHLDLRDFLTDHTSSPQLVQQGDVTDGMGRHFFFPAIYSDNQNRVGMIMSRSSASEFASVQVSGRLPTDDLGTMSEPIQLAIGDTGTGGRWGDYLDIAIDPNNDKTFWIVGMYAKNFGWQTWIDSFSVEADCPPDLNSDGVLDFFDISAFLSAYNNGDLSVDFIADGSLDFFDISAYLSLFSLGCP